MRGGASAGLALGNILIGGLVAVQRLCPVEAGKQNVDDLIKIVLCRKWPDKRYSELAGTLARQFTKKRF